MMENFHLNQEYEPSQHALDQVNPLLRFASRLLSLLANLRLERNPTDPEKLKHSVSNELSSFIETCRLHNIETQTLNKSSYVLCTALDEAVLVTHWGHTSGWAHQGLLSSFHQDVSGGEKFYHILKSLSDDPKRNIDLLELMYLCLAMGFQGRYKVVANGDDKILKVREWLYNIIVKQRGAPDKGLSDHWKGENCTHTELSDGIPLWIKLAIAGACAGLIYTYFLFTINKESDAVLNQTVNIQPAVPELASSPVVTKRITTITDLLNLEIISGQLEVIENNRFAKITLSGDGMFNPGSAAVNEAITQLLIKIGQYLNRVKGQIEISGHSDSIPIRTTRFPSNWHLSQARADEVASIIKSNLLSPERVSSEGRASLESIASNDTRQGRNKNRRVEILVLP